MKWNQDSFLDCFHLVLEYLDKKCSTRATFFFDFDWYEVGVMNVVP